MTASDDSFICSTCGKSHEGLPTDTAYTLPDVVWAIPEHERATRAKFNRDLCKFEDRHFIRCILPIRFSERPDYYGWGIWVEVDKVVFDRYYELYDEDGSSEPEFSGRLANEVPTYPESIGLSVLVQIQDGRNRPNVRFPTGASHRYALDQENGISEARYHEILIATGALEP